MKLRSTSVIALLTSVALLAACDGRQNSYNASQGGITGGGGFSKSDIGTGLGAATGAIIGSSFGKGNGRVVGGVIGGLLGAGIGQSVGQSLDRADMQYYNQAQYSALERGQPGQALPWSNPQSGNSGNFVAQAPYKAPTGEYCREFTQTIMVGGQSQKAYGTACRQSDGNWQIVSQ
jgi:surface antigen